jgi:hypothetical protein
MRKISCKKALESRKDHSAATAITVINIRGDRVEAILSVNKASLPGEGAKQ